MTDDRCFMQLTEAQMNEGSAWVDVDQVIVVHETKTFTLIYLAGVELPVAVREDVATVMERMSEATAKAAP
jgi:hypothetical protein